MPLDAEVDETLKEELRSGTAIGTRTTPGVANLKTIHIVRLARERLRA